MKRGHFLAVWGWHGSRQGPIPRAGVTQGACGGRCASSLAFLPEGPGEPPKVVEHVSDFRKTSCQRFAGSTWQQQQRQK